MVPPVLLSHTIFCGEQLVVSQETRHGRSQRTKMAPVLLSDTIFCGEQLIVSQATRHGRSQRTEEIMLLNKVMPSP